MCKCRSYNKPEWGGTDEELVLSSPPWMEKSNGVCVDRCIAHVIEYLWANGVQTVACCCGHNQPSLGPMLVLAEGQRSGGVRELIESVDDRPWRIQQWQLVEVEDHRSTTMSAGIA